MWARWVDIEIEIGSDRTGFDSIQFDSIRYLRWKEGEPGAGAGEG